MLSYTFAVVTARALPSSSHNHHLALISPVDTTIAQWDGQTCAVSNLQLVSRAHTNETVTRGFPLPSPWPLPPIWRNAAGRGLFWRASVLYIPSRPKKRDFKVQIVEVDSSLFAVAALKQDPTFDSDRTNAGATNLLFPVFPSYFVLAS